MAKMAQPKFMIRLDTKKTAGASEQIESTHLQCDYATMNVNVLLTNCCSALIACLPHLSVIATIQRLQQELQRAVNELSSAHSQRMTRYIR